MARELEGKVAIVTGAASGIGLASAEAMLAGGSRVVMVDRDEAALKALCSRHGNAAIPLVTIVGLEFGVLLGGAVITETIFAWPGVGRLAVDAIFSRDYPLVQAIVAMLATLFVLINLIMDLVYTYLDPRIVFVRVKP